MNLIRWSESLNKWVYMSVGETTNARLLDNKPSSYYAKSSDLKQLDLDTKEKYQEIIKALEEELKTLEDLIEGVKQELLDSTGEELQAINGDIEALGEELKDKHSEVLELIEQAKEESSVYGNYSVNFNEENDTLELLYKKDGEDIEPESTF